MINFKDFVFGQIDEVVEPVTQAQQKSLKERLYMIVCLKSA